MYERIEDQRTHPPCRRSPQPNTRTSGDRGHAAGEEAAAAEHGGGGILSRRRARLRGRALGHAQQAAQGLGAANHGSKLRTTQVKNWVCVAFFCRGSVGPIGRGCAVLSGLQHLACARSSVQSFEESGAARQALSRPTSTARGPRRPANSSFCRPLCWLQHPRAAPTHLVWAEERKARARLS